MGRTILVAVVGLATGAGATYVVMSRFPESRSAAEQRPVADRVVRSSDPAVLGTARPVAGVPVAERAAVLQRVADADLATLRAMANELRNGAESRRASLALEAIVLRMIEIEPNAAIDFVRDADVGPATALSIALAVLDATGCNSRNIDGILAALPALDRRQFEARAVEALASTDPRAAMDLAQEIGAETVAADLAFAYGREASRLELLTRVAAIWAETDVDAALNAAERLRDPAERQAFESVLLSRLAETDPLSALARAGDFSNSWNPRFGLAMQAIRRIAAEDPQKALRYAEDVGGQTGDTLRQQALMQWATVDPLAAYVYAERLPATGQKQGLLSSIAATYARADPQAALAWSRTLGSAPPGLRESILTGIAQTDPALALDIAFEESGSNAGFGGPSSLGEVISIVARTGQVDLRQLADRIAGLGNRIDRSQALTMLAVAWAGADADEAVYWFADNMDGLDAGSVAGIAGQLARADPLTAARHTDLVPETLRAQWIAAVASGYAQTDAIGARTWIQQFRGQPGYDGALASIVNVTAFNDPAGAAELVGGMSVSDPAAISAASVVAGQWARQDRFAARNWAASLPAGRLRDAALQGLLSSSDTLPDAAMLALLSTRQARQQATLNAIYRIARLDPDEARRLANLHIDDPRQREAAARYIDNVSNPNNTAVLRGGFID